MTTNTIMDRWIRPAAPTAVAVVGLILSIASWSFVWNREARIAQLEFGERARSHAIALQSGIDDYGDRLAAVRALFQTAEHVIGRQEFIDFSQDLLQRDRAILNMSWIPRVSNESRLQHELRARVAGLRGYEIKTFDPGGRLVRAPERAEYYPLLYFGQGTASHELHGLDLADDGFRQRTLERARDTGRLATSPPLRLKGNAAGKTGFFQVLPVYRGHAADMSVSERRANLVGFVQGIFQIDAMIEQILNALVTPAGLDLYFYNANETKPLYVHSARSRTEAAAVPDKAELLAGRHWRGTLSVGDATWTLIAVPGPGGPGIPSRLGSLLVLFGGLVLTAAISLYLVSSRRHARQLIAANRQLDDTLRALNEANSRLQEQNLRFDAALDNMSQGLCLFDREEKLLVSNRRYAEMYGLDPQRIQVGVTLREIFAMRSERGSVPTNGVHLLHPVPVDGRIEPLEREVELEDGRIVRMVRRPLPNGGWVSTHEDITATRRAQERLAHMANHDPLTNLPNRTNLRSQIERRLAKLGPNDSFALLAIDLDQFKSVNDTLGHPIGDELLKAVAGRIRECLREEDVVARLGGDEFNVLQIGAIAQPAASAALAARLIQVVSEPYDLHGHQIVIGMSVGIALAPADGQSADDLVRNADLALYRAKTEGRGTYRFFEPEMDARAQRRRRMELDLRCAVARSEFELHYQPIVDVTTGDLTGMEALVRWRHPEHGLLGAGEFIPLAEETGLIVPLGEWILGEACAEAASWPKPVRIAVNLSPVQFRNRDLVKTVAGALERSGLSPDRLELEITESVLLHDSAVTLATLHRLRALGTAISMDDFGTGYSSLGYLRSFPFDKIKIDQSFIRDLTENGDCMAIVRAVTGLGRSLGIKTTAEGVQSLQQLSLLRAEGCTEAQGFLIGRPMPASYLMGLFLGGTRLQSYAA